MILLLSLIHIQMCIRDRLDMVPDIVSRFSKGKNDDLNLDYVKVDEAEDDKQD